MSLYNPEPFVLDQNSDILIEKEIQLFLSKVIEIKKQKYLETQERKLENQFIDYDVDPDVVVLTKPEILFPRFKPTPSKPVMTKWEEFAKSKGIQKKKKSKLVHDQATDSWVPRYGKDSIGKLNKKRDIIREDDGTKDPFKEAERERKISKVRQDLNEQSNRLRKKGIDIRGNPKKDS